jgi:hypothetical protein
VLPERPVGVHGTTRRVGVLGDQLHVRERGEKGEPEGDEEGGPDSPARVGTHLTGQRVDARAEDVTEDEEREKWAADHPAQLVGFSAGLLPGDGFGGHLMPPFLRRW